MIPVESAITIDGYLLQVIVFKIRIQRLTAVSEG
jgi:hypothetical protein